MSTAPLNTILTTQPQVPFAVPDEPDMPLGPEHAGILMSLEEFDAIEDYDDNYFYELIHGVLVVSPLPYVSQTGPNEELGRMLLNYRDEHPQGNSLDATFPEQYVLTPINRRRADRVIWAGLGRPPKLRTETATITVEFVSRAKRDRHRDYVEKREEYLAAGVAEYWIIDRFHRNMTVIRKTPGGVQEFLVQENETYRTPLLPGFELPLAKVLAAADLARQSE
jgi:Uma2 family endonuclease